MAWDMKVEESQVLAPLWSWDPLLLPLDITTPGFLALGLQEFHQRTLTLLGLQPQTGHYSLGFLGLLTDLLSSQGLQLVWDPSVSITRRANP
jgi:hypothetical protein